MKPAARNANMMVCLDASKQGAWELWSGGGRASEGSSRLLSAELGNVAGLFAAAIVIFLLAPLQRFAERVASAPMPNTRDTPEYAAFRKLQVYEAAVKDAMQGGEISAKERALLNRLRDSLGISSVDAERIEREWNAAG